MVLMTHGGMHSRRLMVGEYPIVAAKVGKNILKDRDALQQDNAVPTNHVLQSVIIERTSEKSLDDVGSAVP